MIFIICLTFLVYINLASAGIIASETTGSRVSEYFTEPSHASHRSMSPIPVIADSSIIIEKKIVPYAGGKYFQGYTLNIITYVKNIGKDTLKDVKIIEFVDSNLELLVIPENDLESFKNAEIYKNNSFSIHRDILKPGQIFSYQYDIKLINIGDFTLDTSVESYRHHEIDHHMHIRVLPNDPIFLVEAKLKDYEIIIDDPIEIIYNIKYLGGSNDPYNCTINFDPSGDYTMQFINNHSFKANQENEVRLNILYLKPGLYSLPALSIVESQTKIINSFNFPITIKVVTWFEKYIYLIIVIITSILALIAGIIGVHSSKKSEREWLNQRRRLTEDLELSQTYIMNQLKKNEEASSNKTLKNCENGDFQSDKKQN